MTHDDRWHLEVSDDLLVVGENLIKVEGRLPLLQLEPIERASAAALLDSAAPGISAATRTLVLDTAAGNPLAVLELAHVVTGEGERSWLLSTPLPLTKRLEGLFTAQLAALPAAVKTLLLFAALDEGGGLPRVLAAAALTEGRTFDFGELTPAVDLRLVIIDGERISFRHPLVRSAVHHDASADKRQAAHAVLARLYADIPHRAAWHRAAARSGTDDEVGDELAKLAEASLARGAPAEAAAALERAAELTGDPVRRGDRLVRAADLQYQLGSPERVGRLLDQARSLDLAHRDRVVWSMLHEMVDQRSWSGTGRLASFADIAEELAEAGEVQRAVEMESRRGSSSATHSGASADSPHHPLSNRPGQVMNGRHSRTLVTVTPSVAKYGSSASRRSTAARLWASTMMTAPESSANGPAICTTPSSCSLASLFRWAGRAARRSSVGSSLSSTIHTLAHTSHRPVDPATFRRLDRSRAEV